MVGVCTVGSWIVGAAAGAPPGAVGAPMPPRPPAPPPSCAKAPKLNAKTKPHAAARRIRRFTKCYLPYTLEKDGTCRPSLSRRERRLLVLLRTRAAIIGEA